MTGFASVGESGVVSKPSWRSPGIHPAEPAADEAVRKVLVEEGWLGADPAYRGRHSRYRAIALQVLYECDTTHHPLSQVLQRRFASLRQNGMALTSRGQDLVRGLVSGAWEERDEIDRIIGGAARRFPVDTLSVLDRNIMRLAVQEMLEPTMAKSIKVIVVEAVALAERYGTDQSPAFVHGVLGAVSQRLARRADYTFPEETGR